MRKKKKKKKENQEAAFTSGLGPRPRLTPIDVQQKEFRLAFRGYNERDVDEFLDLVTEELAAYVEENRRLQDQDGMAGFTSPSGGIDATDVSREAEEILARARAKAGAIVRDAEEGAAAIIGPAAAGTGDHRAMIGPFLSREREFLQSLGQLVQEHAETVRRMVKVAKDRAASAEPAATEALDGAEEEVIPIEPAQSTARIASEHRPQGRGSVRELFWGEE